MGADKDEGLGAGRGPLRLGPAKGAIQAGRGLQRGRGRAARRRRRARGHHSLFIALCRAANIPARTVWVPEFCYAEFYLSTAKGEGHWIPCQPAGARTFGEMPDTKPILAKGDSFHPPYHSNVKQMRYLAEDLDATPLNKGGGRPQVKAIHQLVN